MKIDRNNFLIAAAILGLGTAAVPACGGASTETERERETEVAMETEGGEYEREVETDVETESEDGERTMTRTRHVECEAEGDLAHLCRDGQRSARLVEPRQARPGETQAQPVAAGPKPEVTYEGQTPAAANPPQAGSDSDGPTRE
jgi:hypothetical protein